MCASSPSMSNVMLLMRCCVRLCVLLWNANAEVSAGEQVTCSLRFNGAAFCWGSNANDELGNGASLTEGQARS